VKIKGRKKKKQRDKETNIEKILNRRRDIVNRIYTRLNGQIIV